MQTARIHRLGGQKSICLPHHRVGAKKQPDSCPIAISRHERTHIIEKLRDDATAWQRSNQEQLQPTRVESSEKSIRNEMASGLSGAHASDGDGDGGGPSAIGYNPIDSDHSAVVLCLDTSAAHNKTRARLLRRRRLSLGALPIVGKAAASRGRTRAIAR